MLWRHNLMVDWISPCASGERPSWLAGGRWVLCMAGYVALPSYLCENTWLVVWLDSFENHNLSCCENTWSVMWLVGWRYILQLHVTKTQPPFCLSRRVDRHLCLKSDACSPKIDTWKMKFNLMMHWQSFWFCMFRVIHFSFVLICYV